MGGRKGVLREEESERKEGKEEKGRREGGERRAGTTGSVGGLRLRQVTSERSLVDVQRITLTENCLAGGGGRERGRADRRRGRLKSWTEAAAWRQ